MTSNQDVDRLFGNTNKPREKDKEKDKAEQFCVWRINYEALVKPTNGMEVLGDDPITMFDYIDILADKDARNAITKAVDHIMDSEKFSLEVEELIISGVKKLAVAEI